MICTFAGTVHAGDVDSRASENESTMRTTKNILIEIMEVLLALSQHEFLLDLNKCGDQCQDPSGQNSLIVWIIASELRRKMLDSPSHKVILHMEAV